MGLLETTKGRQLAEGAVEEANSLMGPNTKLRLRTSWGPNDEGGKPEAATVYLLNSSGAPSLYMVVVPSDCKCIFVQPERYEAWIEQHSTALSSMLSVSAKHILAFMLLHEVAHVINGDPGEFNDHPSTGLTQKEREERADALAVQVLTSAAQRTSDMPAWLSAQELQMELANLSWNVQIRRQTEYFGSAILGTPAAFSDTSYSHPNFELRILTVNNLISHSPTSRELLDEFLSHRGQKGRLNNRVDPLSQIMH
jgi:hypothetical protein